MANIARYLGATEQCTGRCFGLPLVMTKEVHLCDVWCVVEEVDLDW
jgi:hypothetical protein